MEPPRSRVYCVKLSSWVGEKASEGWLSMTMTLGERKDSGSVGICWGESLRQSPGGADGPIHHFSVEGGDWMRMERESFSGQRSVGFSFMVAVDFGRGLGG